MKNLMFAALLFTGLTAFADPKLKLVTKGFERPVWVDFPSNHENKILVMEQEGKIWVVDRKTGEKSRKPFLDIKKRVSRKANEEGLFCSALAPDFAESGVFYVNFTNREQQTEIVRLKADPQKLTCDPATAETILSYKQTFKNHNGGWLAFGPDGYLYIATGDGGSGNDPKNAAQDMTSLLGKMLRIDVSSTSKYLIPKDNPYTGDKNIRPEIYSYGLRNPWRCSWDRKTKDFYIADVGQNHFEEINFHPAGKGMSGANYGWRLREGFNSTPKKGIGGDKPKANIEPIYEYKHGFDALQGISVTGGFVYRGSTEELQGQYIFADYGNPRIWSFKAEEQPGGTVNDLTDQLKPKKGKLKNIVSFAEDPNGELFLIDHSGEIYLITN